MSPLEKECPVPDAGELNRTVSTPSIHDPSALRTDSISKPALYSSPAVLLPKFAAVSSTCPSVNMFEAVEVAVVSFSLNQRLLPDVVPKE